MMNHIEVYILANKMDFEEKYALQFFFFKTMTDIPIKNIETLDCLFNKLFISKGSSKRTNNCCNRKIWLVILYIYMTTTGWRQLLSWVDLSVFLPLSLCLCSLPHHSAYRYTLSLFISFVSCMKLFTFLEVTHLPLKDISMLYDCLRKNL